MTTLTLFSEFPLPLSELAGLRPRAWLCLGPGFGREEVKNLLFEQGLSLGDRSLLSLDTLAARIAGVPLDRILSATARQEVLRLLLNEPRILARMPELRRLRRQRGFFRKLDRSIQAGRLATAHEFELQAIEARLDERLGPSPVREEIQVLTQSYEIWLEAQGYEDPPRVLRQAIEKLSVLTREGLRPFELPETIYRIFYQSPESLEKTFWEALAGVVRVESLSPGSREQGGGKSPETEEGRSSIDWQRWHTLDDAAEALACRLAELSPEEQAQHTILIPDVTGVRRSMRRALENWKVPISDPRDPMKLRFDEAIKQSLLILEVVASRMDRRQVIAWLGARPDFSSLERAQWSREIHSRGIRQGLESYRGGVLGRLHQALCGLQERLGGRMTFSEFAGAWLKELESEATSLLGPLDRARVLPFLEKLLTQLKDDLVRVERDGKRAPLLLWIERVRERLEQASPPVERFKPRQGVTLSRLGQAPLRGAKTLHFFGFPPRWLSGENVGDLWFSDRDRELLGMEFGLRCSISVRQDRVRMLQAWDAVVQRVASESRTQDSSIAAVEFWDAQYDWDGREREGLLPVFRELGWESRVRGPLLRGAHPRWAPSFEPERPVVPGAIQLPSLTELGVSRVAATEIDHYSRCAFVGLAKGRWKLYDSREAEADLWPDARGRILHAAIQFLLEARDESGQWGLSIDDALERAWQKEKPRGLLAGQRLEALARRKAREVLEVFVREEERYWARARTRVFSIEGPKLEWHTREGWVISGIPDRVDEHPDGLFILDFKSSSALPKGQEMVEQGYRLQLPFYALAVARQAQKPVIGVQFVELNKKGARGSGIFFSQWNGKEPGNLTQVRAGASKSLLKESPEVVWEKVLEHLEREVASYARGEFRAQPKLAKECDSCAYFDLCGRGRMVTQPASGSEEGEGAE